MADRTSIELRPLTDLDADEVQAVVAETVQRVTDDNPNLDLRRGVFAELLAYYHAVLDTQRRANLRDYLNGRSLVAIEADPALADPSLVDDVLSNFRLTRKAGAVSAGEVTVVLSDSVSVTVAQGSVWQARGKRFTAPIVYSAKVEAGQVVGEGDRLLARTSDGRWAFTITVVAEAEGPAYDVPKDTMFVPVAVPTAFVTAFAANDFAGGRLTESNAELVDRLQEGIAAKALSNRVNMAAALRAEDAFSRVVATSIVGYGDAELARAFHTIFPVALGSRADWYVRTQELAFKRKLAVTAALVEKLADGTGVWQFNVGRDDVPGVYEFVDVRQAGEDAAAASGGYEVVGDERGFDVTGGGFVPDVRTAAEAAYSAYSTAAVRFRDTDTDATALALGATREYEAAAVCLPLVGEIQAHVNSRDVRHYGGDCLVKAPVPCFVQLNLTVYKRAGAADPDLAAMKDALAAAVNRVGFVGALYGSQLQDVVYRFLTDGQTASAVDMLGRLRYPDGSAVWLRDSEVIEVPDDPGNMVTARTVQFFADPSQIGVSVTTTGTGG
jgi:hypothetical protein